MPYRTGRYEWDDDSLTPGQKKEGGWHGNLYDSEGNLRGSARFVPDDDHESGEDSVSSNTYIPTERRRQSGDSDVLAEAATILLTSALAVVAAHAAPHVKRWWSDTAQPRFAAQAGKVTSRLHCTRTSEGLQAKQTDDLAVLSQELTARPDRPVMSRVEAQARLVAAMAAQAFSEEQLRLVNQANILDTGGIEEINKQLTGLPQEQLVAIVEQMARKPSLLEDEGLANLASLLGQTEPAINQRDIENLS